MVNACTFSVECLCTVPPRHITFYVYGRQRPGWGRGWGIPYLKSLKDSGPAPLTGSAHSPRFSYDFYNSLSRTTIHPIPLFHPVLIVMRSIAPQEPTVDLSQKLHAFDRRPPCCHPMQQLPTIIGMWHKTAPLISDEVRIEGIREDGDAAHLQRVNHSPKQRSTSRGLPARICD